MNAVWNSPVETEEIHDKPQSSHVVWPR